MVLFVIYCFSEYKNVRLRVNERLINKTSELINNWRKCLCVIKWKDMSQYGIKYVLLRLIKTH